MNSDFPINLFLLPSENKNNKYINLFSSSLHKANPLTNVIALKGDSLVNVIPYLSLSKTSGAKNIIHVQWSTVLYGSRFLLKSLFLFAVNIFLLIFIKSFFRFKIVWTIHNFSAHDYPHPFIDTIGRRILFAISNCVVVQQQSTLSSYRARYPHKNVQYVPHGNYIDVYGMPIERDYALRRSLGFKDDDIVLISLGAIAPYKLNEKIIDAVVAARKEAPNLKLLIAGKGNERYVETLIHRASTDPGIVVQNRFISDSDLPRYLSIVDYSVFYYDQSEMTSGGMILSLSYGVPVIIRDIPAAEIVTSKNGHIFNKEDELVNILKKIKSSPTQQHSRGIINDMRVFDWSNSAKNLINIYDNL